MSVDCTQIQAYPSALHYLCHSGLDSLVPLYTAPSKDYITVCVCVCVCVCVPAGEGKSLSGGSSGRSSGGGGGGGGGGGSSSDETIKSILEHARREMQAQQQALIQVAHGGRGASASH